MNINNIKVLYFSPCGSVEKVAKLVGERIANRFNVEREFISYTLACEREVYHNFEQDDLLIWATPVYAGKVPNKTLDFINEKISSKGCLSVGIVLYGNRNYDNALSELSAIMKDKSMKLIGAACVVARHSFSNTLAKGRPNKEDISQIEDFADKITEKIENSSKENIIEISVPGEAEAPYYTPKKEDSQPAKFLKAKPKCKNELCKSCGLCEERCTMNSIHLENGKPMFEGICIKCQACVRLCPESAIYFDDEDLLSHIRMLEENYSTPRANEFFL